MIRYHLSSCISIFLPAVRHARPWIHWISVLGCLVPFPILALPPCVPRITARISPNSATIFYGIGNYSTTPLLWINQGQRLRQRLMTAAPAWPATHDQRAFARRGGTVRDPGLQMSWLSLLEEPWMPADGVKCSRLVPSSSAGHSIDWCIRLPYARYVRNFRGYPIPLCHRSTRPYR